MGYLNWNTAIGNYFFNAANAYRRVTLYLDRRRIDAIGTQNGLGGWEAFLHAAGERVDALFPLFEGNLWHPLGVANGLRCLWLERRGSINGVSIPSLAFPPVLVGLALLVLAWTEGDDAETRSYYHRVTRFFEDHFALLLTQHSKLISYVRDLIDTLPELGKWLDNYHGRALGSLAEGRLSSHRWVGAIRYHALLDGEERDRLPQLWTEMGLQPKRSIAGKRLVEMAITQPSLGSQFPTLSRVIHRVNGEWRTAVEELLEDEYQAWDGNLAWFISPNGKASRIPRPRLLIQFEKRKPSRVLVDWAMELGILHCEGASYAISKIPDRALGMLVDAITGTPIIPDSFWMFENVLMLGEAAKVFRKKRDHFWMWQASDLGYHIAGYVEANSLLADTSFLLVATGKSKQKAEAWCDIPHSFQAKQVEFLAENIVVIKGSHIRLDPFDPSDKEEESGDSLKLVLEGGKRIHGDVYVAELPPKILIPTFCTLDYALEAHALDRGQNPLTLMRTGNHRFEVHPFTPMATGGYLLQLRDPIGDVVTETRMALQGCEPLPHTPNAPALAFNADGTYEEITEAKISFLNNRFWGGAPMTRPNLDRFLMDDQSGTLPDVAGLELGYLMAAAGREGNLKVATWQELIHDLANRLGTEAPTAQALRYLRNAMTSLGFFHYSYPNQELLLSPLRLWMLPDDFHSLRAVLLGVIPAAVLDFIRIWSKRHNRGIRFHWIEQEPRFLPPLLRLDTYDHRHYLRMCEAVNAHFPNSIQLFTQGSLSESLLSWLDPLPAPPCKPLNPEWTSFPYHEAQWDVFHGNFRSGGWTLRFPALTRTPNRYDRQWHWRWWLHEGAGYDVHHFHAIPTLHQQHGKPFIAQHVARTDEVLLVGSYRQPELLERALVMATGLLPQTITASQVPEWEKVFHPDAAVRVFAGIRPPLRVQLRRIFGQVTPPDSTSSFPQVHLML